MAYNQHPVTHFDIAYVNLGGGLQILSTRRDAKNFNAFRQLDLCLRTVISAQGKMTSLDLGNGSDGSGRLR
jgi:hypothetical protein